MIKASKVELEKGKQQQGFEKPCSLKKNGGEWLDRYSLSLTLNKKFLFQGN